jgi:hypothetical protein
MPPLRAQQTLRRSPFWRDQLCRLTRTLRQQWFWPRLLLPSTNLLTLGVIKTATVEF